MLNLAHAIKAEITRLTAKEIRATGAVATIRGLVRRVKRLERQAKALEARLARSERARQTEAAPASAPPAEAAKGARRGGRRFGVTPESLKRLRGKLGVTQKELASLLAVSGNAVWQWEAGRAKPRGKTLANIQALSKTGKREARRRLEQ